MVVYAKLQQWKKGESGRIRGEGDKVKFIDRRFKRWQVIRFGKARRRQAVP